jgi:hypothetical protein
MRLFVSSFRWCSGRRCLIVQPANAPPKITMKTIIPNRSTYAVNEDEITEYVTHRHIYGEAAEYSNPRIYAYLVQSQMAAHMADKDTDE